MLATTQAAATEAPQPTLQRTLERIADEAKPGVLGITVVDLDTHARSRVNADRAYPMMSVFLMYRQTTPNRMRAGLPADVRFADKCGTSYSLAGETAAYNDMGIITWPNGHTVIVAAFLTSSKADKQARDALFAKLGKSVAEATSPDGR